MEFKQLEEVNKRLKPIDIKGKDYNTVNQRVLAFRELFPEGSIQTEIISYDGDSVLMKTTIYDGVGRILATGHAREEKERQRRPSSRSRFCRELLLDVILPLI